MRAVFFAGRFAVFRETAAHVLPHGLDDFHVLGRHRREEPLDAIELELVLLMSGHHSALELFPAAPTLLLSLLAASFGPFKALADLVARFFHATLEVAFPSLQLHIESVPVDHARNNTSDKKF